ncbi:MAG: hypothetical protein R3F14_22780 [Polyangiaceae bacterium]
MRSLPLSLRLALTPLLAGVVVMACFEQPRPVEELFDAPFPTDEFCVTDAACRSGGPCTRGFCSFEQRCVYAPDDSLIPDDGQPCTVDSCSGGIAKHAPASSGTACGEGLSCDGAGTCTGCGGDASKCGVASCIDWTCPANACEPDFAERGQPLPLAEQVPGDCSLLQCDGAGGVEQILYDDPLPESDPCVERDCLTGGVRNKPAGVVCGGQCVPGSNGFAGLLLHECDGEGQCLSGELTQCTAGFACQGAACNTLCVTSVQCLPGASCVGTKCLFDPGPLQDCQTYCAARAVVGCPEGLGGPSCEQECISLVTSAVGSCADEAGALAACRAAAGGVAGDCAELSSACGAEHKALLACQGEAVPDGPGCGAALPCVTGFDGCTCGAFCGGALYADQCAPNGDEEGTFTCTCAKDGVTVATCETAPGCGVETGCCASAM